MKKMNHYSNQLKELETRVSRGDPSAEGELLDELEPQMVFMVRRALRTSPGDSPLDRMIRKEIDRLTPEPGQGRSLEERGLVRQIAQRVCAAMIDRLRPSPMEYRERDTIPAGRVGLRFVPRMDRMRTVMMPDER